MNRVLMALDQGAVEDARALVDEVEVRLARPLEPSLEAQLAWAKGLLRWAEGDLEAAETEFAVACDGALAGGRLLEGWNVARAATIVRAALGRLPNSWLQTERALRQEIVAHLTPTDRVFFLANRGDAVDQDIAAALDRAVDPEATFTALRVIQGARWGAVNEATDARPRDGGRRASWSTRIWQQLGLRRGFGEEPLDPSWLPPTCALLYQVSLEREVAIFVVTRSGCRVVRRRCPRTELAARAAAAVGEASARGTRLSNELYSPRSALGRLADAVGIDEVTASFGPEISRVFVVPDGPCVQAPWAALPCGAAPWIERVEIALVSALRPSQARWRLGSGATLRGIAATHAGDPPLPFARDDVSQMHGGAWAFASTLASTTEEIERALIGADGAHCACHGVFDAEAPSSSGLRVGPGLLDLDAISRLELRRLGLLVLASCWTGALSQLPGREFFGVPIALHAAGVGAVIAPLWAVSDQYGPTFARAFWEGAAAEDAVGALARVQRRHWRSRHPRLWAPWGVWVDGVGAAYARGVADLSSDSRQGG
ncbi:MAG: CHAT domain-containing protein [Polyangiales bacterium]